MHCNVVDNPVVAPESRQVRTIDGLLLRLLGVPESIILFGIVSISQVDEIAMK